MEDLLFSMSILHAHCESCFNTQCNITTDGLNSCELVDCENRCGHRFHGCKRQEHNLLCSHQKIPCINYSYGCRLVMPRFHIAAHLRVCPASIVKCVEEWNRWPMHSKEDCVKMPLPLDSHHVKCTQLDVALALRDQRMLTQAMKVPKKIRKIFQNSLTERYPSVPLLEQSRSPSIESDITVEDGATSDEDTPWGSHRCPPGLERTVVNQLHKASKQTAASVSAALDLFSHHFGRAGLKHLSQCLSDINESAEATSTSQRSDSTRHKHEQSRKELPEKFIQEKTLSKDELCPIEINKQVQQTEDIYTQNIKLFDLLGVSIDLEFLSKFIPKPKNMYTFLCAQDFRREEYPWHFKNVHSDIHCGLNGMIEVRCPLAYMGCDFSCEKLVPLEPKGKIVHSSLQESFGLLLDHLDYDKEKDDAVHCRLLDDIHCDNRKGKYCRLCLESCNNDRRKLREVTPEITTSQKYNSSIKILPKYQCKSTCDNSMFLSNLTIECLPFEVLQYLFLFLDSFSLNNISLTCKFLRDVCASVLDQKGMVVPVWQCNLEGPKKSWSVSYWRWCFSSSFTPIRKWEYQNGNRLFEHLKICPYNQENCRNIKTEPHCIAPGLLTLNSPPIGRTT